MSFYTLTQVGNGEDNLSHCAASHHTRTQGMGDNTDDTQILRDAIENALAIADGQQRYLMAALLAHCLDELADTPPASA